VSGRSILPSLLLGVMVVVGPVGAAEPCAECVTAGAAYAELRVPPGTPLAGYGGLPRRLPFPDILSRHAHAFWLRPSVGQHDPVAARALVLEGRATRVAWVTLDLIAVDRSFTRAVQDRLTRMGVPAAALIVSASHTHSGPGAFMDSELRGLVAVDRMDPMVREALVEGAATAIRRADAARAPALVAATRVAAPPVTASRIGRPLDSEIVVVKITGVGGEPLALIWNFAIHGTMLSATNMHMSGDVMGLASALLERRLGAPALFVNGAVGDVSPAGHGAVALSRTADALAAAVEAAWGEAKPVPVSSLRVSRRTVTLPRPAVSLRRCIGHWLPGFFAIPLGFELPGETELLAVAVADTAWVTIPGELQTSFGQTIKREGGRLFDSVLLAGLSNDYLGYFTTAEAVARKGYIACATLYGPDGGPCLTEGALELLYQLAERPRPAERSWPRCDVNPGRR
jgi:neutral ceramidase